MRTKFVVLTVAFVLSLAGLWIACSRESGVAPIDQPPPVEGDAGAELFEWAIGPIDGITTAWHPMPREITVPVGTTLRLKCGGAPSSRMEWKNAEEVSGGDLGSIAECHIAAPGRHEISVAVGSARPREDRIQEYSDDPAGRGNRPASFRRMCIVNAIEVGPAQIGVVALEPRVVPLALTESSSNYETMKALRVGNTISRFRRLELNHYRTAVNRPIALGAKLIDSRFASIIETRISGERPILGAERIDLEMPGQYTVSVGPPMRDKSVVIETYKVSITSHQKGRDFVRDGERTTFVAATDPPGHEDEITWISSTKYGEAHPIVGHGPSFTVEFRSTVGSDGDPEPSQWLGVRADNAVFSQDQLGPQLELRQLTIEMDHLTTNFSQWGHAELTFTGSPAIQYFNLSVNGQWPIRNMPIQSVDGVGAVQGVSFGFDLGVPVGTQVTSVNGGWSLTNTIVGSMPPQTGSLVVTQRYLYEYFGEEEFPRAVYTAPPVLIGGQAQEQSKHNNEDFPNQESGVCKCVPTAVSNSLKFLKTRHKLNIADAAITPAQMETATGWNSTTMKCPSGWWNTKNTYMQNNNIPITTMTSMDIECAIKAIDKGCDVEIGAGAHRAALVGVTRLGGGKYAITVKHDVQQGQAGGTGKEGTQDGTYDAGTKKVTGGIQWFNDVTLINFVIECPAGVDPGC
jgi:hypothetical protein